MYRKFSLIIVSIVTSVLFNTAMAGNVTIPNSFSAGSPAVADEVNGNFNAVKSAVDDNHNRISNLETSSVSVAGSSFISSIYDAGTPCKFERNQNGRLLLAIGSGFGCNAHAHIQLPHGRTLTGMTCSVYDRDTSESSKVNFIQLRRAPLNGAAVDIIFGDGLSSIENPALQQMINDTPTVGTEVVDNESYVYYIHASLDSSNSGFKDDISINGCTISYQ